MMKYPAITLIFSGLMLVANAAIALPQPSVKDIVSLKAACAEIAQEDSLPESEIAPFLLDCVNDQLNERGYERVENLDGMPQNIDSEQGENPTEKSLIELLVEEDDLNQ
ncbi:hypothetical protein [Shewanella sp. OMA3-2]|uniref:hypothetical protein n=1 Tax=Shewanella sp. OMA3-2 TaxID=2908650 RepID=UPI001F429E15|nr:hypothetical protein [Shewanella sp. OMA3-2]UJF21598.1 hypothetical protein L0B17_16225 [Shewanella sp. OMA3-2]